MTTGSEAKSELDDLARVLLDVVPLVTRSIRAEMRAHRNAELSVPQFRVLGYIQRKGSVSLSDVAEHIGLTLPSMSTMVDVLVGRGLVDRKPDRLDRRRVAIALTDKGQGAWAAAREAACNSMVRRLRNIEGAKRRELLRGLEMLRLLFSEEGDGSPRAGSAP